MPAGELLLKNSMSLTLLLDLDDTLLNTNLPAFMPAYFQALADHVCGHVPSEKFLRALIGGVNRMNENEDPRLTLREVFESYFHPALDIPSNELQDVLEGFYDRVFPSLHSHTSPIPGASDFVDWAVTAGMRIAIATDPLFPIKATHHRLRWAGFEPERFQLVSAFEDFHFAKSHPAYYAEVLGRMGWQDGPALMVGNDPTRDILSAQRLGLKTFFIEGEATSSPGVEAGRGQLSDARRWLESVGQAALEPSFKSRDGVLGILESTPAVLNHFLGLLNERDLQREQTRGDWAMNEIACHLRDTEREVHALQLDLMLEKNDAFIPRPETSVWASERDYLLEDARAAGADFADARVELLARIKSLPEEVWSRPARHAIFGPTNFCEVLGFMADHDRLHLQQAWSALQTLLGERV